MWLGSGTLVRRIQTVFVEVNCALTPWHVAFRITFLHHQIYGITNPVPVISMAENDKISQALSINEGGCCQLHVTGAGVPTTPCPVLLLPGQKESKPPYISNPFQLNSCDRRVGIWLPNSQRECREMWYKYLITTKIFLFILSLFCFPICLALLSVYMFELGIFGEGEADVRQGSRWRHE